MSITISAGTTSSSITQNTVFAGYICSNCRNPIIEIINIQSKAKGRTSGIGKVTEEELEQKSAENIKNATDMLISYLLKPSENLYPKDKEDQVTYLGWNIPCPICGEIESWQDLKLLRTQPVLSEISIFNELESAYDWARVLLETRKNEADRISSSPELTDNLLRLEKDAIATQEKYREEWENGAAVQRVAMLKKRQEILSKDLKAQRAFSKERKSIQEELKNCEREIYAAEDALSKEHKWLECEIAKAEIKRKDCLVLRTCYADGGLLFQKEESIALRLCEKNEMNSTGHAISLRSLPRFASVKVSPFEENKELYEQILASSYLKLISGISTAQSEGGDQ